MESYSAGVATPVFYEPPKGHYLEGSEVERVWDKVVIPTLNPETSCWRWIAATNNKGDAIVNVRA